MNLTNFQIQLDQPISVALEKIGLNKTGAIFIIDGSQRVVGVATDGDIRRSFLKKHTVQSPISAVMNTKFTSVLENTPREQILKMLDHSIRLIPVLSAAGKLIDVVSRESFPLRGESAVIARAKAPVRISFGGGGTDLTHYFVENGGAVLNSTIALYTHSVLRKRNDSKIKIYSRDFSITEEFESFSDLKGYNGELSLITSLLGLIRPSYGFDLSVFSEFPPGSGLGGSSVLLAAIIGCFNQFREDRWDNYEMAEIAFQAERLKLNIAGGWQDQYATIFGGFNFMEFTSESNIVHPLRIQNETIQELEENLIFCHVGGNHNSGKVHEDQKQKFLDDTKIRELVETNKAITYRQKSLLLKGNLTEFGKSLHETWSLKRQFSDKISTETIDKVYEAARGAGALGGKLLGAGGGGYFLFYVRPFERHAVEDVLQGFGLNPQPLRFDPQGLRVWTVRDET